MLGGGENMALKLREELCSGYVVNRCMADSFDKS
jgi:hypothetical protein